MDWTSEAMLALYGTVFGGAGLKFVEWVLGRSGAKDSTAAALRNELRQEIATIRQELEKLKIEAREADAAVDSWRTKYFSLLAAVATKDEAGIQKHLGR